MTLGILIKNGRLIEPLSGFDGLADILIEGERVEKIARSVGKTGHEVIDARGMWVTPGLVDMHVHLRDPGYTHKEDMQTGSAAAAAGGFTSVCAMPNTMPVTDCAEAVKRIAQKSRAGALNIIPCASVTKNQDGLEITDIKGMFQNGVMALSEDGKSVADPLLLKRALEECAVYGIPMLSHCEDARLAGGGVMNAGKRADALNLPGIPASSEAVAAARDIIIAREAGARIHICHVSVKASVELIRAAKKSGVSVTAEAAPHHFILTDCDVDGTDANFKMNPPLRSAEDVCAVLEGLADGTVDCIASDHAPHADYEKAASFKDAPNGIIGLETSVPLCVTRLVGKKILTPLQLIEKMSYAPAKILKFDRGYLKKDSIADITIIDPDEEFVIDSSLFYSKSRNTPFNGQRVRGRVKYTIIGGEIVYRGR